ncbi:MAG TPA: TIGR02186 family protein [Stellaceae bacterium]|nr:TIGR02186 family protein [Stellaceae bacterium]
MTIRRCLARALGFVVALSPIAAQADIVADLSSHSIAITTGFTGASVVLFGAIDGPGDVVVIVRGPERDLTVWRKGKIGGIWANTESVTFASVPTYYAVASSKPPDEALSPAAAGFYRIGVANLKFVPKSDVPPEQARLFTDALIAVQEKAGVFSQTHAKIAFLGERLFRTTFNFPANIPTGVYLVQVYLVRDKDVVGAQTTPLIVSQVGVDAAVFDFAHSRALAYGAIAVVIAVMAGWLASLPFRNA